MATLSEEILLWYLPAASGFHSAIGAKGMYHARDENN